MTTAPEHFDEPSIVLDVLRAAAIRSTQPAPAERYGLGDIVNANYRRHITARAARLGVAERDLAYAVTWRALLGDIAREDVA